LSPIVGKRKLNALLARPPLLIPTLAPMGHPPLALWPQDRDIARHHVVGVEFADGEVVDDSVLGPSLDGCDLDMGTGAGAEPHARFESAGLGPSAGTFGAEGVVVGGDDDSGLFALVVMRGDGDLDQVLGTGSGDRDEDGLGFGLAGRRVGGEDFVTDLVALNGFGGAANLIITTS
jgi:hypothetical protein